MKKVLKRALSFFLAFVLAVTSMAVVSFSAFAGSKEDDYAKQLRASIEAYEDKMDGTLYTNMSAAYEAYVDACTAYDIYYYGDGCTNATYTAAEITAYADALDAAVENMEVWTNEITYATSAADGSYDPTALATGGDELNGAIYSYGVSGDAANTSYDDNIDNHYARTQYGSVVFLYTGSDQTYSFPVNFITKKTYSLATARGVAWFTFAGTSAYATANNGNYLNDGAFQLYKVWHGYSNTATYMTKSDYTCGYGSQEDSMWDGSSRTDSDTTNEYYSNTLYYTQVPTDTLTTYTWLDYEYQNTEGSSGTPTYYAAVYPNSGIARYNKTESNIVSAGSTVKISKKNDSGAATQAIYIINYKTLTDAIDTYTTGSYARFLTLGSDALSNEYYRHGTLSAYFEALDEMLSINPTDSSKANNYNGTNYYIDSTSTSEDLETKATACANDINKAVSDMESAVESATADAGRYINLRGDSNFNKGYTQLVDENGNNVYGIDSLLPTYLNGNPEDPESSDGSLTYTEDSWAAFAEAFELAQAVMKYGAQNGYQNNYPASSFSSSYDNSILENVNIYDDEGNYIYDESYFTTEDGTTYYLQVYDRDNDGIISVDEALEALNRAYENLKLNYSVVDAALLQALINEAKTLINSSSYFTDTSYSNANLESVISQAEIAIWGSEDNFGVDANLLRKTDDNQALVDEWVTQLTNAINKLIINEKKTVASAGGYSIDTALSYSSALDQTLYANWNEVLQPVLDETNAYLDAYDNADNTEYGTSTNVQVDATSTATVPGSAYQYITDYIDLVNRLYIGILSLQIAFTAIENGEVANTGQTVTAEGYGDSDGHLSNHWYFGVTYQKGLTYFRTTNNEVNFSIPNLTFKFGTEANYDAMLDSININAINDWSGIASSTSTIANQIKSKSSSTGAWYLTDSEKETYNGCLNYDAKYGTFNINDVKVTSSTARTTYDGYNNYYFDDDGNLVTGADISDNTKIGIIDKSFDWTDCLSVTDGYGGSNGIIQGGVLAHSTDDDGSYGYVNLSGDFIYTQPAYEKEELSADTKITLTQETDGNSIAALYYLKCYYAMTWYAYNYMCVPYCTDISVVDVTYLFDLIDEVKDLDSAFYTTDSWNDFYEAYQTAISNMDYTTMKLSKFKKLVSRDMMISGEHIRH